MKITKKNIICVSCGSGNVEFEKEVIPAVIGRSSKVFRYICSDCGIEFSVPNSGINYKLYNIEYYNNMKLKNKIEHLLKMEEI